MLTRGTQVLHTQEISQLFSRWNATHRAATRRHWPKENPHATLSPRFFIVKNVIILTQLFITPALARVRRRTEVQNDIWSLAGSPQPIPLTTSLKSSMGHPAWQRASDAFRSDWQAADGRFFTYPGRLKAGEPYDSCQDHELRRSWQFAACSTCSHSYIPRWRPPPGNAAGKKATSARSPPATTTSPTITPADALQTTIRASESIGRTRRVEFRQSNVS